ncbi:MAG TPA: hypothetical protein VF644_16395 [Pyrinomonadaceae bacterium]
MNWQQKLISCDFSGLGALVEKVNGDGLKLQTTANRGVKVYPDGMPDTFTVDHRRRRFVSDTGEGNTVDKNRLISLEQRLGNAGLDVIKTENLYNFDGAKGYST